MFRVGDVVEREGLVRSTQHIVKSINPEETHISIDDTEYRHCAVYYNLITPVWHVGDKAKITKHGPNFGKEFIVQAVWNNNLYDHENYLNVWRPKEDCERIGLAPKPIKPLVHAELKTTLAREMEIPTYLYDVLEVKPRIKPGAVQVGPCTIDIETEENGVVLSNIELSTWNANDLRKLAKLCTDLADLMG